MKRLTGRAPDGTAYLYNMGGTNAAIDRLSAYEDTGLEPEELEHCPCKTLRTHGNRIFAEMLVTMDAPTVGGWISVNDRPPEEDDYKECHENPDGAVFWFNGKEIGMGWYYTSTRTWSDLNDCEVKDVTHWMPLPEPPEEVTQDD